MRIFEISLNILDLNEFDQILAFTCLEVGLDGFTSNSESGPSAAYIQVSDIQASGISENKWCIMNSN